MPAAKIAPRPLSTLFGLSSDFARDDFNRIIHFLKHLENPLEFLLVITALAFEQSGKQLPDKSAEGTMRPCFGV
jgi:hypothetical protein